MSIRLSTLASLALLLLPAILASQATPPKISAKADQTAVEAGAQFSATVTIEFAEGLHGYQNPPSDPINIPLEIKSAGDGTNVVRVDYPQGSLKPFPGFDFPLAVYEGTIRVPVVLKAPTAPGNAALKLSVKYQQCNDSVCFSPKTDEVTFSVSVKGKTTEVQETVAPPVEAKKPAQILTFFPSTTDVAPGSEIVLSWSTSDATKVTLKSPAGEETVSTGGTKRLTIAQNTTYTISATGTDGNTVTKDLAVTVREATATKTGTVPAPTDATPPQARTGEAPQAGGQPNSAQSDVEQAKQRGLLSYLALAFVAGLAALATPCVWPMIPITVSFFSKRGGEEKRDMRGATAYSLGIMATFTAIGVVVAAVFGAAGIQRLATNPWVNLGLVLVFVALAASLFGVFEIAVPQSWLNKAQGGTKKQGLVGPVLMGVVFTLTSFTCTVPFVGALLFSAAQGDLVFPILGMLAFSLAFALPFFGLALFPQYLAALPKSGSWLADVKSYMGFLELAAAVKFLSNVDLAFIWGFLTKPAFLSLWVGLFAVAGLWLLHWLRLPHDGSTVPGWPRRFFGVVNLAIAAYFLAAMNGAPLGALSGFLPPEPYPGREGTTAKATGQTQWVFTYEEALTIAKNTNKPVFLNFTGDQCVNCRYMENTVFIEPTVKAIIDSTVPVWLVTDRDTDESRENAALREKLTQSVANPAYVILKPNGDKVSVLPGSTQGPGPFKDWMTEAIGAAQ